MAQMLIWLISIAVGVSLLIVTAAAPYYGLHTLICALISFIIAVLAVRENERRIDDRGKILDLAATNARAMGSIWAWGVAVLVGTYGTGVLTWGEWWHFALAFGAAGILCLVFANLLLRAKTDELSAERILRLSRLLALVQLIGMVVVMIGLLVDGKMDFEERDWAGNNVFFFGAASLAVISFVSLRSYNRQLGVGPAQV